MKPPKIHGRAVMTLPSVVACISVPFPVPIRFASETHLVFSDGGVHFVVIPCPTATDLDQDFLSALRERWPHLVQPIEIIDLGPPRLPAHPKSTENWTENRLHVQTADGHEIPLLGALSAFRPAIVCRAINGGPSELVFEDGIMLRLSPLPSNTRRRWR